MIVNVRVQIVMVKLVDHMLINVFGSAVGVKTENDKRELIQ